MTTTPERLAVLALDDDADVFAARQRARDIASAVGLDRLDATRIATAISELARETVAAGGGRLAFGVRGGFELLVTLSSPGLGPDAPSVRSAERLVDSLRLDPRDEELVAELAMRVGAAAPIDRARLEALIAGSGPTHPLEELRQQNAELASLLDTVRAKNADLERLNAELEETNRGVMALYTELSDELERTNQGVVALYAEIDEKNERLAAASEAKSRFLRSVSHELRTPVNSVLGLTRLLADPGAGPLSSEQAEQVEFIRTSAADLDALVNELLDLARAESGRLEPVPQDVDLGEVCRDLGALVTPLLRDGVRLEVDLGAAVPPLRTDPDLLRHVVRNLLSNAAKFTVEGTVRTTVEEDGDDVLIRVADTGVGMSEEERSQVFEEFFQARTPLHASTKGTGLGLPFALSVAEALGGGIEVESTPGVGSRFTLRLPRQLEVDA